MILRGKLSQTVKQNNLLYDETITILLILQCVKEKTSVQFVNFKLEGC